MEYTEQGIRQAILDREDLEELTKARFRILFDHKPSWGTDCKPDSAFRFAWEEESVVLDCRYRPCCTCGGRSDKYHSFVFPLRYLWLPVESILAEVSKEETAIQQQKDALLDQNNQAAAQARKTAEIQQLKALQQKYPEAKENCFEDPSAAN